MILGYGGGVANIDVRRNDMLYLEQTRNRVIFMTASLAATVTLMATIHGINAVGVLFAAAIINIIIYYTLPDRYSQAYVQKKKNYFN